MTCDRICENCKFANFYPEVEKPVMPERLSKIINDNGEAKRIERTGFSKWFFGTGRDELNVLNAVIEWNRIQKPYLNFTNYIWCERFPETVKKSRKDTCGEFKSVTDTE
jgi:hypothetical protein